MRAIGCLVLVGVLLIGCDRTPAEVKRDGSPRQPDDEGVATSLTHEQITLDGERTYDVSRRLVAFSTYSPGKLEPMLARRGQYVHIGLDGKTMVWMAGVAAVADLGDSKRVFYSGVLETIEDGRMTFEDGTVLRPARGLKIADEIGLVQVEIDPESHRVVAVRRSGD